MGSNARGWYVYLANNRQLFSSNPFDTPTVTNMHIVFAAQEVSRVQNVMLNMNGTSYGNPFRWTCHTPWVDGSFYWDTADAGNRRTVVNNTGVTVGQRFTFSAYISSAAGRNGARVNGGTLFQSTSTTVATASNGMILNFPAEGSANHFVYGMSVFNARLASNDESFMESNL
jgi:hypothetical protein